MAALGETVFLVGRRHDRLRVLDEVEGPGFLRAAPGIGDVVPSDVTAVGKLYAVLSGRGDARLAPGEAEAIAGQGYATNRDAWIEGLSVLAAPIWAGPAEREPIAALAMAAATPRFERLGEARVARRLLAAAAAVGARLGGASDASPRAPRRQDEPAR